MSIQKTSQILENQLEIALSRFHTVLPSGLTREQLRSAIEKPDLAEGFRLEYPLFHKTYVENVAKLAALRRGFAANILSIAQNPAAFGVELDWRSSQLDALECLSVGLRRGHQRLPFEMPSGGGKSLIFGALIRAYIDSARSEGLPVGEIVLLTSRTNLARQAVGHTIYTAREKREIGSEILDLGDVVKWLKGAIRSDQIRVVIGNDRGEHCSDPVLTIETYQGLSSRRINAMHFSKMVGLILCDEAHNVTERVRMLINCSFPGGLVVGGSATIKGPGRNPFLMFESNIRAARDNSASFESQLAFHTTLPELMTRRQLKPLRWVQADTSIDLSGLALNKNARYKESDIAQVISSNIGLLKDTVKRTFESEHPVLNFAGARPLRERTHIGFVKRIGIAEELAHYCTAELGIPALHTSGSDSDRVFQEKKRLLASGEIKMLLSCRKLTEGFDAPEIDAVWLLWPHQTNSEWMLIQEIGRGLRIDPNAPRKDCLVVDAVYKSNSKNLIDIMGIFGCHSSFSAGFLAPGDMREVEGRILELLQAEHAIEEIPELLSAAELHIAQEIGWKFTARPASHGPSTGDVDRRDACISSIEFIERKDVREYLLRNDESLKFELIRESLDKAGFKSRYDVLFANTREFERTDFGGFKGITLYNLVTGKNCSRISKRQTKEIADMLFPASREEDLNYCRGLLSDAGYSDRFSFLLATTTKFESQLIGPLSGRMFYSFITGKNFSIDLGAELLREHIVELADILFPDSKAERLNKIRKILAEHGITDPVTLAEWTPSRFQRTDFGGPKGAAMYRIITGKFLGAGAFIERVHLDEIAEILFPNEKSALHDHYRAALAKNGINGRSDLLQCSLRQLLEMDFDGKRFYAIYKKLTGEASGSKLRIEHVVQIADLLFPTTPEQIREEQRTLLRAAGYADRNDFIFGKAVHFFKSDFNGLKGEAFWSLVTGKKHHSGAGFSREQFLEVADVLYPATPGQDRAYYRLLLKQHGILSEEQAAQYNLKLFQELQFRSLKGEAFCSLVLGQPIGRHISRSIMKTFARVVFSND